MLTAMRTVTVVMQTTLDNRIATADGTFWEPMTYGPDEERYVNRVFEQADTWVMGRRLYDVVAPWWDAVVRGETPDDVDEVSGSELAFAGEWARLRKIVISRSRPSTPDRPVIGGDIAAELAALKQGEGGSIVLACGPATLAPIAAVPGLVDEYLLVVHPMVVSSGPRLFADVTRDIPLRLVEGRIFDSGILVLRYAVS